MINKELFIRCINSLRIVDQFQDGVCKLVNTLNKQDVYGEFSDLGAMMYPDCSGSLLDLLTEIMNDTNGDIAYFCYDLHFGEEWHEGCMTERDPETGDEIDIKLKTVDDLWDFLATRQRNK